MFIALKSLYTAVSSCVRINGVTTDWFDVKNGLRQGCSLSPILFNLFINDFALSLKALGKGIKLQDDDKICILMYADDIVLLAENENDLQSMLNLLDNWCGVNCLKINPTKSQIVHFRPISMPKTTLKFICGANELQVVDRYVYLGLTLKEFLDFNEMAKTVAKAASRALGLLIAKCKILGGMPFEVYSKLYDTLVWPVISYGAAVWGEKSYSCIEAIQNRAMRFYLGVGRYTPCAGVSGDMGWTPTWIRQWKSVSNVWSRHSVLPNACINKRIFMYAYHNGNNRCKNWPFRIKSHLNDLNCLLFYNVEQRISKRDMSEQVTSAMEFIYVNRWKETLNNDRGVSGRGGNKLRKYRLFKSQYETETYCKTIMA